MAKDKAATVMMPALHREASIVAGSLDAEKRTFDIVWTAGAEVPRIDWWTGQRYVEMLEVSEKAIRLDRLESGRAPVLDSHNRYQLDNVLGVVEKGSSKIAGGQARATVRMSSREDVAGLVADIRDGIIANVSPGYITHSYREELRDGTTYRIATDWEPIEISFVPVGADPDAGLQRSAGQPAGPQGPTYPCIIERAAPATQETAMTEAEKKAAEEAKRAADKAAADKIEADKRAADEAKAREEAAKKPAQPEGWARGDIAKITSRALAFGLDATVATEILADDKVRTLDEATDALQARAADKSQRNPRQTPHVQVTADAADKTRAAVETAIMLRARPDALQPTDQANRDRIDMARAWRGMSLLEMGRAYLEETQGVRLRGLGKMELATVLLGLETLGTRAVGLQSTSDFANVLANVLNKRLRDAYTLAPQTWKMLGRQSNAPDFKQKSVVQLSSAPAFKQVREGAEFTYGGLTDGKEVYSLATYGRIISVTRQTLINDDLGAFDRLPMLMGRQAAELEAATFWSVITANAALSDTVALFHATHGNLAGSGTAIDTTNLGLARAAMRKQKSLTAKAADAEPLNLTPKYLVVSPDKEVEAQQALTAVLAAQSSNVNIFAGSLTQITEARLTGNAWYLVADPATIDTIEYAYLEGEEGLFVEQRVGFEVDGIEVKGRVDFAAKAIDYRGMYKNAGN